MNDTERAKIDLIEALLRIRKATDSRGLPIRLLNGDHADSLKALVTRLWSKAEDVVFVRVTPHGIEPDPLGAETNARHLALAAEAYACRLTYDRMRASERRETDMGAR
jgi:hypothetical protein